MEPFRIHPDTTLGPTRLIVADMQRSLGFYQGVLGMQVARRAGGSLALGAGGAPLLIIDERPGARPKPPQATGLYHVALLLPSRRDLARVIRRLVEARYPLSGGSDHLVSEALYLDDPDGNGIEIYADRPRESWGYTNDQVRMAVDPLDINGILGELQGDGEAWAGMPAGSSVGHVHLHVRDLPSAEAFYSGVLGFEVMARYGPGALFVAAGGYHHHLGLNTWAGVGAPPPPPGSAGLVYFALHPPAPAAYAAVIERVREAAVAIEETADGLLIRDPAQNGVLLQRPDAPVV